MDDTPDFDVALSCLLYRFPKNCFIVQIGANDGITGDPVNRFIAEYRLPGLLVEPQSQVFASLKRTYAGHDNLIFDDVAIAAEDGFKSLYTIREDFRDHYDSFTGRSATCLSSFDKSQLRKMLLRRMGEFLRDKDVDDYIQVEQIRTVTFDTLFRRHNVTNVNLLQVDAEGFDYEILKLFDFKTFEPEIVHYETTHLSGDDQKGCIKFLRGMNYRLFRSGINLYGLHSKVLD